MRLARWRRVSGAAAAYSLYVAVAAVHIGLEYDILFKKKRERCEKNCLPSNAVHFSLDDIGMMTTCLLDGGGV